MPRGGVTESLEQRWLRMTEIETQLHSRGIAHIAGLDEAGRGPLAGPVAAAAVILPPEARILGLDDSKKLSEKKRLLLEEQIKRQALAWSVSLVGPEIIDRINIREAARVAMTQAVRQLRISPEYLLIDALTLDLPLPQLDLIKGDSRSASIAAASIIAKNTRDRLMLAYEQEYPGYGFARHKGYPTPAHKAALRQLGPCPIHRLTFKY